MIKKFYSGLSKKVYIFYTIIYHYWRIKILKNFYDHCSRSHVSQLMSRCMNIQWRRMSTVRQESVLVMSAWTVDNCREQRSNGVDKHWRRDQLTRFVERRGHSGGVLQVVIVLMLLHVVNVPVYKANSAFHPLGVDYWVVSFNSWCYNCSFSRGALWRTTR